MNRPKSALAALLLTIVAAAPAGAEQAYSTPLPAAAVGEGPLSAGPAACLIEVASLRHAVGVWITTSPAIELVTTSRNAECVDGRKQRRPTGYSPIAECEFRL
jgi:hypothetical protein